jgi:hypothetical protein
MGRLPADLLFYAWDDEVEFRRFVVEVAWRFADATQGPLEHRIEEAVVGYFNDLSERYDGAALEVSAAKAAAKAAEEEAEEEAEEDYEEAEKDQTEEEEEEVEEASEEEPEEEPEEEAEDKPEAVTVPNVPADHPIHDEVRALLPAFADLQATTQARGFRPSSQSIEAGVAVWASFNALAKYRPDEHYREIFAFVRYTIKPVCFAAMGRELPQEPK